MNTTSAVRNFAVAIFAVAALTAAASTSDAAIARRHTKLVKSDPAKDSTVASPKAIQLWFNEKVDLGLAKVALADAAGVDVALGAKARDAANDDKVVSAAVKAPLAAGKYTVKWTVAGDDGHPTNGSFDFTVKGAK